MPRVKKKALKKEKSEVAEMQPHPKNGEMLPDEREHCRKKFVRQCLRRGVTGKMAETLANRRYPGKVV